MNIGAAISLGIGVASFIIGIIWKVVDLSMGYGKLSQRVDTNEKELVTGMERDREERAKNRAKFEAVYKRLSTSEADTAVLKVAVSSMQQTLSRLEGKLDRIIERGGKDEHKS